MKQLEIAEKFTTVASDIPDLGPISRQVLEAAQITSMSQLKKMGAVDAYIEIKKSGMLVSLTLLWRLHAVITGRPWQQIAREERAELLASLVEQESLNGV